MKTIFFIDIINQSKFSSEAYLEGMKTILATIQYLDGHKSEAYLEGMKTRPLRTLVRPGRVSPKPTSKE